MRFGIAGAADEGGEQHLARRRAFRKQGGRKQHAQRLPPLAARNEQAEAIQRVGHRTARKTERDIDHARIVDGAELGGQVRRQRLQQAGAGPGRNGQHGASGREHAARTLGFPAAGRAPQRRHRRLGQQSVSQPHRQSLRQRAHAFAKTDQAAFRRRAGRPALARPPQRASDERPRLLLQGVDPGRGGADRQLFRIPCIDAGNERIDRPVEKFWPQPTAHEIGHALLARRPATERFGQQAQLGRQTEQGRAQKIHGAGGQGHRPPPAADVTPPRRRIGLDHAIVQTEGVEQMRQTFRAPIEQGIGAEIDPITRLAQGADRAAGLGPGFEQAHARAAAAKLKCERKAGDACAHDQNIIHGVLRRFLKKPLHPISSPGASPSPATWARAAPWNSTAKPRSTNVGAPAKAACAALSGTEPASPPLG